MSLPRDRSHRGNKCHTAHTAAAALIFRLYDTIVFSFLPMYCTIGLTFSSLLFSTLLYSTLLCVQETRGSTSGQSAGQDEQFRGGRRGHLSGKMSSRGGRTCRCVWMCVSACAVLCRIVSCCLKSHSTAQHYTVLFLSQTRCASICLHTSHETHLPCSLFTPGSPMGAALLALIGGIYRDRARAESSSLDGYSIAFRQSGRI